MRQLVSYLSRSAVLRNAVRTLRLHRLGNAWLRKFPNQRTLPESGVRYRAVRLESMPLAVEMFDRGSLYEAGLLPKNLTTFADLGCNVGYFSCWLMHLNKGRKLKGLMVDANPEATREAGWHAQANGMPDLHALNGIVGEGKAGSHVEFFLCESSVCSTRHLPKEEEDKMAGKWERIRVPCLEVEAEWRKRFGDERCQLLKLDVEGSELSFLKQEPAFLGRCDSVLLEWHKWAVSFGELQDCLRDLGFEHVKTLEEGEQLGTAYFRKAN